MKRKDDTATPGATAEERSPVETFDVFLESVPDVDRVTVSLRRMPSYITPQVSTMESLPAPVFQADLEAMQNEIRARHGPGRYKLWVRWRHPESRKLDRVTAPEFTLAPVAEDYSQARGGADGGGDVPDVSGQVQESMQRLARAANIKAQANELHALKIAVDGPGPGGSGDSLGQIKTMAEILKALTPQTDPLTLLKTAKDLLQPSTPHDAAGTLSLLDKLGDVLQKFAGEGGSSRSEGFWNFATEAMRHVGPNLPAILDVASRVISQRGQIDQAQPAAIAPAVSTAKAIPENSPQAIAKELTGGDPHALLALSTWLNMALVEVSGPLASTMPQDGYALLLDYLDTHLPMVLQRWTTAPPEAVWTVWTSMDPRVAQIPSARTWLDGFLQAAKAPADGPPGDGHE